MNEQLAKVDKIATSAKVSWATGALGANILLASIAGMGMFYMTNILKIEPVIAGLLLSGTKLVDVVTDPLMGLWSDRVKTRIGRRRPFLLPGAIISAISLIMFFTAPNFENHAFLIGYMLFTLLIYTVGYTIFNVPYMSMPAEMTDGYHERSSIHAYRVIFVTIGGLVTGSIAPWLLEDMGREEASSYATLGIAGGVIVFVSMAIAFFGTKNTRFTSPVGTKANLLAEFKAVSANKHFLRLICVKIAQLLGVAIAGPAMFYFLLNTLQLDLKIQSYFFVAITVSAFIAAPMFIKLSKKIGKSQSYMVSASIFIVYALSWAFAQPGEPLGLILLRGFLVGVVSTGNIMLAMSMLTDTIEYDAKVTGERREGIYTSMFSLVEKSTFALGPLILGAALSFAGFEQNQPIEQAQTPAVRQALLLSMAYLPAALSLISIFILAGFKLDEKALAEVKNKNEE